MAIGLKSFLKNSSILVISNVAAKLINFIMLPLFTAALPPGAYGVTDTVINFSSLIMRLLSLSVDWGMESYFYEERTDSYQKKITSSCNVFFAAATIVCLSLGLFSKPISSALLQTPDYAYAVFLGFVIASIELVFFSMRVSTRMRGNIKMVGLFSFIQLLINIVCNILFILVFHWGYLSILYSSIISYIVVAALYTVENRKYIALGDFDKGLMKKLLRYSVPILPTMLTQWINNSSDRLLIVYFKGEYDAGLYSIAARIVGILSALLNSLPTAYVSFAMDNAERKENRPLYSVVYDCLVIILGSMAFAVSLFAKEIMFLMTDSAYHLAYVAVGPLVYGYVFYMLQTVVGYALAIRKKSSYYTVFSAVGAGINVLLNILFIPSFGYAAAAWTTFASQFIIFIICFVLSEKVFYCNYKLSKSLLVTLLPFAATVFLEISFFYRIIVFLIYMLALYILYRDRINAVYVQLKKFIKEKQRKS